MIKKGNLPLLLCLILMAFVSCKKEINTGFDCSINGINNIISKVGDTQTINIQIAKTQGTPENVSLSLINVPAGVSYFFETNQGIPNYNTTLTISVSTTVKTGTHVLTLEAKSENLDKFVNFNLSINDTITLVMKVYDSSKWSLDQPNGGNADSAIVQLYKDSDSFANQTPYYTTMTDNVGVADFYHVPPGTYLFTVEKSNLSNIGSKKFINGKLMGFASTNIDNYGNLIYRDQNSDGKITDADRVQYDMLILYSNTASQRTVWIGP